MLNNSQLSNQLIWNVSSSHQMMKYKLMEACTDTVGLTITHTYTHLLKRFLLHCNAV